MDLFSEALIRLKHQLRVSKDQEVAVALGISKTAFSERKKRSSFPEREVVDLAARKPELNIDVGYVLTGIESAARALLDKKQARIAAMADAGMSFEEIKAAEAQLDPANVNATAALLLRLPAKDRAALHHLALSLVRAYESKFF